MTELLAIHGALTLGLTSYPAMETRLAVTHDAWPAVSVELAAIASVLKAEPLRVQVGVHWAVIKW